MPLAARSLAHLTASPQEAFLEAATAQGVTPLYYLQALHPFEWANLKERLGAGGAPNTSLWSRDADAAGHAIDGTAEVRRWASLRGQTLARTVRGVMEYARAMRLLTFLDLVIRGARHVGADSADAALMTRAAEAAEWLTARRFMYVIAAQKYGDSSADDATRRADIDGLLAMHPLLRVAYLEDGRDAAGKATCFSVCMVPGSGGRPQARYRLPLPGHAIRDGLTEGKPTNQDNGAIYAHARIVQALDMNQELYVEEASKWPNVAREFIPDRQLRRPVALVGAREHVFTSSLSTTAMFMSLQELHFGVVLQRVMHKLLHTRLHYGHPDFCDRHFATARGGFAKASRGINVSEDVYAGLNALLRGGDSKQVEYYQAGKGRDVGMLQVSVFESKVAAGSAVSLTSRDACRASHGLEFLRTLSLYHTWAGFYIVCATTAAVTMLYAYFVAVLASAGIMGIVVPLSASAAFLGDVLFAQWLTQLGGLYLLPLLALFALEFGAWSAVKRGLHLIATLGPAFYICHMHTRAVYVDSALSFGSSKYMATGRDFVIRHVPFVENYRAIGATHLHFGVELIMLMIVTLVCGEFATVVPFFIFFSGTWVYALSLLWGFIWFNPYAMDLRAVLADLSGFARWLWPPASAPAGDDSLRHSAWVSKSVHAPYESAPMWARLYHAFRLLRWLALALAITFRQSLSHASATSWISEGIFLAVLLLVPLALVLTLELVGRCLQPSTSAGCCSRLGSTIVHALLALVPLAVAILVAVLAPVDSGDRAAPAAAVAVLFSLLLMVWFYSQVALVLCGPRTLGRAALAVQWAADAVIGFSLLLVQLSLAAVVPFGNSLHAHMLFSGRYAYMLEVMVGARPIPDGGSSAATPSGAGAHPTTVGAGTATTTTTVTTRS